MVDLLKDWNPNKYMVEVENEDGLLDKLSKSKTGEVIIDDKGKEDIEFQMINQLQNNKIRDYERKLREDERQRFINISRKRERRISPAEFQDYLKNIKLEDIDTALNTRNPQNIQKLPFSFVYNDNKETLDFLRTVWYNS